MDDYMKYIIVENGLILFSFALSHFDVSKGYVGEVISAGFFSVDLDDGSVQTFGNSTTLKKESREQDAEIIKRELNRWKR